MLIAIASPSALPMPRTTPVIMPDFAAGIVTLKIVWILLAPSASDAARSSSGTARIEDALTLTTVGRIMIASTITAQSRLDPPVN